LQGRLTKANEGQPEIQGDEPESSLPEPAAH